MDKELINEIKQTIKKRTYKYGSHGNKEPYYCYLKDIADLYEVTRQDIQTILDTMGDYKILYIKKGTDWDSNYIIAHKNCSEDIVKQDYFNFFDVEPEIEIISKLPNIKTSLGEDYNIKSSMLAYNLAGSDIEDEPNGINEDVDLNENIEIHDNLNPKLFKDDKLLPEVKKALLKIAYNFTEGLEDDEINFNISDIKFLGSNASYNYTENSDIDLHIVMETESLHCPDNLYPLLYSAYRSIWNKNHDVNIKGIPVEIFVETDDTEQLSEARQQTAVKSNGIYSVLQDKWIKKPTKQSIPELDKPAFDELFDEWYDKYEAVKKERTEESIANFIEDLYDLRKTSIAEDGEYGIGNLVFKEFRNLGYLDYLKDEKNNIIDKELTL